MVTISGSLNARAQEITQYDLTVRQNEVYIWEVVELDLNGFRNIFGFDPIFSEGEQIKKVIRSIQTIATGWLLKVESWDYKDDWNENGTEERHRIYDYGALYDEEVFLPVPVDGYLEDTQPFVEDEGYIMTGHTVVKLESNFRLEITYNDRGVKLSEIYYDRTDNIIVKVEGTFKMIPMGNYYIFFVFPSIIGVIIVLIAKKKLRVKNL
jgi:hypothetical protein